ncbi:outer membrane protein [Microvirga guangxiensis]|uniref:Outer membrane immunogenic protein n=1 Tax=Microvirga guangxiensis TaxID=549386 RepID=A0A1G5LLY1_9HYPH|nr:outer membrane protein [Microvirga guangxiensis]SCZ13915.1 outer membrane immunogenic protein [Microvirga guangxiensis]
MKNLLLSATALVALTAAASAADLPSRYAPAPAVAAVPVFTWTGFYVGANAGYAWGDSEVSLSSADPDFFGALEVAGFGRSSNEGSFTGGAQVGYNHQIGAAVIGLETDISYLNLNDHYEAVVSETALGGALVETETLRAGHKVQWFGTLRARLGFTPAERLLVYATGGVAYGSVKSHSSYVTDLNGDPLMSFNGSNSDTRWGWTIGGGAEYAFTNNLSLKGEYLYVNLDSKHYAAATPDVPGVTYRVKDETAFHVLRAGLNYKFGTY